MNSYVKRIVATIAAILVYGWVNALLNPVATVLAGQVAGKQFENDNVSYVESVVGMDFFSHIGIPALVLLVVLVAIWWKPLKDVAGKLLMVALVASGLFVGTTDNASAYYDKSDYAEPYFILPNESAFYIPDVGANKNSQVSFGSEAYLAANKIAAKRFIIPHVKLENSGLFSNYYVPAGRLIIVDRTSYNREWVAGADRGTSKKNESFPCQSSEGINVTVGISIASSVTEENAPKFLFSFGVNSPKGSRTDPNVVFTSVFYGRSLAEVMDSVVRGKIQALVCEEVTKRTIDANNKEANTMMKTIETNVKNFLTTRGITLDYIGWADTFTFDPAVQKAIDDKYIATTVASSIPVLQQQAVIEVKRGLAKGLEKGLPSFLPGNMAEWIGGFFKSSEPSPAHAVKK